MAGKNMSICAVQTSEKEGVDRLYAFLKTGADSTSLETNDDSVEGLNPDDYPNPPERAERDGTSEAMWGQHDSEKEDRSGTAQHHSNAVWDGFRQGRERFLERNFDSFGPSSKQTVEHLSEALDHFKSGDHESSKPFTNSHSKRLPEVVSTVLDKTKNLLK